MTVTSNDIVNQFNDTSINNIIDYINYLIMHIVATCYFTHIISIYLYHVIFAIATHVCHIWSCLTIVTTISTTIKAGQTSGWWLEPTGLLVTLPMFSTTDHHHNVITPLFVFVQSKCQQWWGCSAGTSVKIWPIIWVVWLNNNDWFNVFLPSQPWFLPFWFK